MSIVTVGIDISKHVFQLHGVDAKGDTVLRKRLTRGQFIEFFTDFPSCLIGMEACSGAHHWARELQALGHNVRLMPAQYVKPYVKRNKHDMADAEAICEAVTRPTMRFVEIKSLEQQGMLMLHRARELLVKQRTMLANALRAHLAEFGIVVAQGLCNITKLEMALTDQADDDIPSVAREVFDILFQQIRHINEKIDTLEKRLLIWHKSNENSQRLATIPGIGPLSATALIATIGEIRNFKSARHFSAWLGLTPKEYSTGGKIRSGRISKRGDGYIRRLLVHGARAVVRCRTRKNAAPSPWLDGLLARKAKNIATVALANKNARVVWALLAKKEMYRKSLITGITA